MLFHVKCQTKARKLFPQPKYGHTTLCLNVFTSTDKGRQHEQTGNTWLYFYFVTQGNYCGVSNVSCEQGAFLQPRFDRSGKKERKYKAIHACCGQWTQPGGAAKGNINVLKHKPVHSWAVFEYLTARLLHPSESGRLYLVNFVASGEWKHQQTSQPNKKRMLLSRA